MSATLDAKLFEDYFGATVLYIQGRQYPVDMFYTDKPEANYLDATLLAILQIHLEESEGDILAFLTGVRFPYSRGSPAHLPQRYEIESLEHLLESKNALLPDVRPLCSLPLLMQQNVDKLLPCPLFGAQTSGVQARVFEPTPKGHRKVVLATNIAETSLTVPNIRCALLRPSMLPDPHLSKVRDRLWHGQGQVLQRKNRD